MAIYQSMQRVRFSSADGYKKFQMLFADVRRHLKPLPGLPASDMVGPSGRSDLVQRSELLDQQGGARGLAHDDLSQVR